jgi:hypothetical protein
VNVTSQIIFFCIELVQHGKLVGIKGVWIHAWLKASDAWIGFLICVSAHIGVMWLKYFCPQDSSVAEIMSGLKLAPGDGAIGILGKLNPMLRKDDDDDGDDSSVMDMPWSY